MSQFNCIYQITRSYKNTISGNRSYKFDIKTEHIQWVRKMIYLRPIYDIITPKDKEISIYNIDKYIKNEIRYLSSHLFFITATFHKNRFSAKDGHSTYDGKRLLDPFRREFLNMCKHFQGPKFNKKRSQQPFVLVFLDVEGSRGNRQARCFQNPHLHAFILIRPEHRDAFVDFIGDGKIHFGEGYDIADMQFREFTADHQGGDYLFSYGSKYALSQIYDDRHMMTFWSFPDDVDWIGSLERSPLLPMFRDYML